MSIYAFLLTSFASKTVVSVQDEALSKTLFARSKCGSNWWSTDHFQCVIWQAWQVTKHFIEDLVIFGSHKISLESLCQNAENLVQCPVSSSAEHCCKRLFCMCGIRCDALNSHQLVMGMVHKQRPFLPLPCQFEGWPGVQSQPWNCCCENCEFSMCLQLLARIIGNFHNKILSWQVDFLCSTRDFVAEDSVWLDLSSHLEVAS